MKCAIIVNETIANVVLWSGIDPFDPSDVYPGYRMMLMQDLPQGVDIGWSLVGGVWSAPETGTD